MQIKGKYKDGIILRCCDEGAWYFDHAFYGSGCCICIHKDSTTYFDYLDKSKLDEVTNKDIIKKAFTEEPPWGQIKIK